MMLGDYEITVLSDGTAPRDLAEIMSAPQTVRQALARAHQTLPIDLSINAFLVNTGARLILVDTGAGALFGPDSGGRLVANLRAAGYRPEQVDAVLLTHIHSDHSGGLSLGGQRVFPHAPVYVDKHDCGSRLGTAADRKPSQAAIDPYAAADALRPFDGAVELFPGIRSMPAYGHTPGHSAYMVESRGRRLLLWGDTVHLADVQFADPAISIDYDDDRRAAVAWRETILAEAAARGYLVGGAHISFPGLGHVRADAKGYSWIVLPYNAGP